jgi:hypothetical protein
VERGSYATGLENDLIVAAAKLSSGDLDWAFLIQIKFLILTRELSSGDIRRSGG